MAIMQTDFTKRQRNILDLVIRMSYGCGKKSALLRPADFELVGVYKTHVRKELDYLAQTRVLFIDGERITLNKDYDQWRVSLVKGAADRKRFEAVLHRNLDKVVTETVTPSERDEKEVTKTGTKVTEIVTPLEEEVTETVTKVTEIVIPLKNDGYQNSNHTVTKTVTEGAPEANYDNGSRAPKESIKESSGVDIPTLTLPTDIYTGLTRLQVPDDATETHKKVAAFLERNGFYCRNEFRVPDRGDGRPGKIDIYAERGNLRLAIEIDRETPREKSIYKLRQVKGALRLILLRAGPANIETPEGVDVVISLAGNARPETVEDVLSKFPRYSSEQLTIIRDYWETIRFTRKTGKVASNIIARQMEYWERFPLDIVLEALEIHIRKYQTKQEDYTAGIMRRLVKEYEQNGVKPDGQRGQYSGANSSEPINLDKFLWQGT